MEKIRKTILDIYNIDMLEVKDKQIYKFIDMLKAFIGTAYEETLSDEIDMIDSLNKEEVSESLKKVIKSNYLSLYLKLYDAIDDILWKLVDDGFLGEEKDDQVW